ncbi:disease resistance protein At4g27190-like [Corylus avellana]|uniref:disease resistance protein At4g27190-like n=1 Tax=Corylus avellana TaxID=13451 RepID=UPI00286A2BDE|nr:disease resistance protein At4g27190-like [Corylus avellana]XP_059439175.1 disease resistance protein At4g27190-like [Corylus avellana]
MEIVAAAVVATGKFLCGSIYSKIKGIIKFQSNLDILEREMKGLLAVKDEVQTETDSAEKEGKVLRTQVIEWLKEVEELQLQVNQIQEKKLSRQSLNCRKRYGINREVVEKLKEIKRLLEAGSSHCGAVAVNHSMPSAVEHIPGPTIQDQTTPSKTLAEIMTLLSDNEVRRIGIWGMGGVGKTTLVRNLNNKLKSISSTQPFGIIIWVTISLNLDMRKVQEQIAERLNLERKMGESMEKLASRLYQRLQKEEKFLLILDDVWEKIDLDNLGVPQPEDHKGSTIILTTRFFDVCRHMMTDVQVRVAVLNDEESWQLFSRNAGNLTNLEHIRPFAKAIVRECCGLPLALVTMGAAMREKTKVELWKHALNELRRPVSCPPNIEHKIYKPLKWSYDSLEGKNIKYCFLYCSLFPEDFSIAISELARCWLAEGLLDEQENYEDSFNCVIHLIENLKDSCLLEDGAREDTVKMHDVVRDVAIWIASSSEDGCKSLVRSGIGLSEMSVVKLSYSPNRVSFMNNKIIRLPDYVVQCSEASTLLLQGNRPLDRVPERFLQGFEALRVLNMSETRIQSMPLSLLQLGELRALLLGGCSCLEKLPPLGGLSKLQVLDLSLTCIRELPKGMENLSNLMHLSLSHTQNLRTIQAGIISRLSCLNVLDMTHSGYCFSVKRDVQEEMACFEELKCLERLLVLYIRLERIPYFSDEDLSWMYRLRQFNFSVGPMPNFVEHEKGMVWSLSSLDLNSEERIGPLLSNASSLNLHKCLGLSDMLKDLVIDCFAGLKSLTISYCDSSVLGGARAKCDLLPNLEKLCLRQLKNGESISQLFVHLRLRFQHLKLLEVELCSKMEYLLDYGDDFFQSLPNLEVIKVRDCDSLGQLFRHHSEQSIAPHLVVPSLRILELDNLPQLSTLSRNEETWPLLEQVHVFNCDGVWKLPLTDQNAENIKEIKGDSKWWFALEWHTETTRSSLQPYFHRIQHRVQGIYQPLGYPDGT